VRFGSARYSNRLIGASVVLTVTDDRRVRILESCTGEIVAEHRLVAPGETSILDAQLLIRFVAAAYERRSLGIGSHWPFESWGRFLPEHTTAVSLLDRLLHHCNTVVTDGDSYRMKQARQRTGGRPKAN
jgi:hypothetical protein